MAKRKIYGRTLAEARAGRADTDRPWSWFLTFENATGPANVLGREVVAVLTPREVASVIGAIPALSVKDDEDVAALGRVIDLFRRLDEEGK